MRNGVPRGIRPVLVTAIALVLVVETVAAASTPETKRRMSDAQRRLAAVEAQLSAAQDRVLAAQELLRSSAEEVERSRFALDVVQRELLQAELDGMQAEASYRDIRNEVDRAVTAAYIEGPVFGLWAILSLESLSDTADLVQYASAIATENARLAAEARKLSISLRMRQSEASTLAYKRVAALSHLTTEQESLTTRFAEQQTHLAALMDARAQLESLLAQLRSQLRAEEIAAAESALRRGTPLSFARWGEAFLKTLGSPVARNNLVVLIAWQTAEYTAARWNPLATTYPMPGATKFNSVGVRNYVSLEQGLQATMLTLGRPGWGYEAILAGLARNADPSVTAQAIRDSSWCSGCANGRYVVALIPSVERYYDSHYQSS